MNSTPIFIINLEKSKDRKVFIESQFSQLEKQSDQKINYQFFTAIYGKENPDFYLFKKYNERKRFSRKGNKMNLSQLGCFASHYLLWEKCIELSQPIIILEDDAIIKDNFLEVYKFIDSEKNQFEFFWLSPPAPRAKNQKGNIVFESLDFTCKVERFYRGWGNATGYFITPRSAKKFLDYMQEWIYDVDISMERYWENKIDYLAITPACIEPDFSKESNIPVDKGKTHRTLLIKIKREFYKFRDSINKFIYDSKE